MNNGTTPAGTFLNQRKINIGSGYDTIYLNGNVVYAFGANPIAMNTFITQF